MSIGRDFSQDGDRFPSQSAIFHRQMRLPEAKFFERLPRAPARIVDPEL